MNNGVIYHHVTYQRAPTQPIQFIPTGTPPNLVLKSIFEATFPGQKSVDYQTWFTVAFPLSLILIICGWTLLCLIYARSSYWNLITGKFIWDKSGERTNLNERQLIFVKMKCTDFIPLPGETEALWQIERQI